MNQDIAPASERSQRNGWGWLPRLTALCAALVLSGCASVYLVDNQVQSFARWSERESPAAAAIPKAPQRYQFERLPSQSEGTSEDRQTRLQALAREALMKVGWTLAETGTPAPWTVQVGATTLRLPYAPWDNPWSVGGWGGYGFPGRDYVVTGSGQVIWMPAYMHLESPYYQRKVSLLIRRNSNGQVVYETHAAHDGRWSDAAGLWSAMLDAALRDFPTPPSGPRQVNVEVPR